MNAEGNMPDRSRGGWSRASVVIFIAALLIGADAAAQSMAFIGTWEWAGTVYVLGGTESPPTTGHTRQLMFGENGEYVRYQDNQVAHSGHWGIVDVYVPPFLIALLTTSDENSWMSWGISDDATPVMTLRNWSEWPASIIDAGSRTEYYGSRGVVPTEKQSWGRTKAEYR